MPRVFIIIVLFMTRVYSILVSKQTDDWTLAFKAVTNGTGSPYALYMSNRTRDGGYDRKQNGALNIKNTACLICGDEHYKSDIVNEWDDMEILQAKVSVFKNDTEVAYFIFNATGYGKDEWFNVDSLLRTNYEDFDFMGEKTSIGQYFSMKGDESRKRRFYINAGYNECTEDVGWLVVAESQLCFSGHQHTISIMFGLNNQSTNWSTAGNDSVADFMAIFVKRRSYEYHCTKYYDKSMEEILQGMDEMQKDMEEFMRSIRNRRASNPFDYRFSSLAIGVVSVLCVLIPITIIVCLDVILWVTTCRRGIRKIVGKRQQEKAEKTRIKQKKTPRFKHPKLTVCARSRINPNPKVVVTKPLR